LPFRYAEYMRRFFSILIAFSLCTACRNTGIIKTTDTADTGATSETGDTGAPTQTWYIDFDNDGYGSDSYIFEAVSQPSGYVDNADDCDDSTADANPDATEVCDGIDNDCDGQVDNDASEDAGTWYLDYDGDGYGAESWPLASCDQPSGYVDNADDCDDTEASAYPGGVEVCDGADNDCNGEVDEDSALDASVWYRDFDGDGFGDADSPTEACDVPSGYVNDDEDCDDTNDEVNPDATEICDEIDNDCDGDTDDADGTVTETSTWYADADGDGYGNALYTTEACDNPAGHSFSNEDCDDTNSDANPGATEVWYDGVDGDCDEANDYDADGDGFESYAESGGEDCDDTNASVYSCGSAEDLPGTTCLQILESDGTLTDGSYWIDPDGAGAFEVECDMTTDGGGWTAVAYSSDFEFGNYKTTGDGWGWVWEFELVLTDDQVSAIQSVSTEGYQEYVGLCDGVIHYNYPSGGSSYVDSIGFRFHDGTETAYGVEEYSPYDIRSIQDGCATNGGEGGHTTTATIFEISSVLVPVTNVYVYDYGNAGEELGSPLTEYPAWLR